MNYSSFAPDFIGVGVMKAASEWILSCLNEHPEICGTSYKEINFFNKQYNYKKGLRYYYKFFNHCPKGKITGEFTPAYMLSPESASLIYKNFPNVKIIVCLRNPAERAYSDYRYNVQWQGRLKIYKDFEATIKNDRDFMERGFYFKQLIDYFKLFPRENILIIFFEDLKKKPLEFIQKIYQFLNVKDVTFVPSQINQKRNITGQYVVKNKLPIINTIIYRLNLRLEENGVIRKMLTKFQVEELLNKFMNINKKRIRSGNIDVLSIEPLKPSTRDYLLNEIYKEDILNLEKLLNIDLSFWH